MKRLLKLIAHLYPSSWRGRYHAEFEALLEDSKPCLQDLCDVFLGALKMQLTTWTFTRITVAACVTGALAAVALSFAIPSHYISATLILANPPADTAATDNNIATTNNAMRSFLVNRKINVLRRDSLGQLIERLDLYPNERAKMPLDAVATKMQSNIRISPVEGTKRPAFYIQFDYPDPHLAQQVDQELVYLFMSPTVVAESQAHPHFTLRVVDRPSLPQSPAGLNRLQIGAIGLVIGLPTGLILATTIRLRRKPLTVPD